jgi:hypothetical protein
MSKVMEVFQVDLIKTFPSRDFHSINRIPLKSLSNFSVIQVSVMMMMIFLRQWENPSSKIVL